MLVSHKLKCTHRHVTALTVTSVPGLHDACIACEGCSLQDMMSTSACSFLQKCPC